MNIGIEAKRLYQNKTGLGNAARSIVHALATYYPMHQYTLFAPSLTTLFSVVPYQNVTSFGPNTALSKTIKTLWRSYGVVQQLNQNNIDLYLGLGAELPLGLAKQSIKAVVMIYDLIYERYPNQYNAIDRYTYRKKTKYACKVAQKVLVISQQTKQDLIDFYKIPATKIEVVYLSCDVQFYKTISAAAIEKTKEYYQLPVQYFLSVGSIIQRKGLLIICEAIKILGEQALPLVVIGGGNNAYVQEVNAFIKANDLQEKIIFLNQQSQSQQASYKNSTDFPAIYQGAKAVVYPSVFEGFGLPVLEAMASGVPVITSNTSCLPEVGGDAAIYVNPTDAHSIAEAMLTLIQSSDLANNCIEKGKIQAAKFSEKVLADRIMKVVGSV